MGFSVYDNNPEYIPRLPSRILVTLTSLDVPKFGTEVLNDRLTVPVR